MNKIISCEIHKIFPGCNFMKNLQFWPLSSILLGITTHILTTIMQFNLTHLILTVCSLCSHENVAPYRMAVKSQ